MNAIQRKRADLERQVASIQAKLAVLAELEAEMGEAVATPAPAVTVAIAPPLSPPVLTTPVTAEVPAGNVPAPTPNRPPGRASERLVLALSAGPQRVQDLARLTDGSLGSTSACLRSNTHLFEKVDPANKQSPYRLTDQGREIASRLATAPAT